MQLISQNNVISILLKPVQTGEDGSVHAGLISSRRSIVNQQLPFSSLPPPLESSISYLRSSTEASRRRESMIPGSLQNRHCEVCIPSPASNTTSFLPSPVPSPASNAAYAAPWALRPPCPRDLAVRSLCDTATPQYSPHRPLVDLPPSPPLTDRAVPCARAVPRPRHHPLP